MNLQNLTIVSPGTMNDGVHGTSNGGAEGPRMAAHCASKRGEQKQGFNCCLFTKYS